MPLAFDPLFSPRTKSNRPGIVYDETKEHVLYVEDIQAVENAIIEIQTYLNETPIGGGSDVKSASIDGFFLDSSFDDLNIKGTEDP